MYFYPYCAGWKIILTCDLKFIQFGRAVSSFVVTMNMHVKWKGCIVVIRGRNRIGRREKWPKKVGRREKLAQKVGRKGNWLRK